MKEKMKSPEGLVRETTDEEKREIEIDLALMRQEIHNISKWKDDWELNSNIWRGRLWNKIEEIFEKLNKLPCDVENVKVKDMKDTINLQWGLMTVIVIAIIYQWVKR